ncbi:acyl-homoserine-lactone synthase [Candidatus Paracaedibacter symbiosus]|uniref:acyl-homoserine-lactone synthase n=1 Tax=Candidatus Paracaedibacter symbiosus TaxID=244582 RepID=UPI000509D06C|nr:acyl-homoserine-lactone synthase [Candidatus Paracaedibacter symbiosus]
MLIHLNAQTSKYHNDILDEFYRIRKKIFIDRLNWDLPAQGDKEIDQYDHNQCNYLLSISNDKVSGGIRLTPSLAPNLTFDTFSDVFNLPTHIKPQNNLLEISRLGIIKTSDEMPSNIVRRKTLELFQGILKFGLCHGYEKIITVTDIRIEKIFKLSDWPLERISEVQQVGNTRALVGFLHITQEYYDKIQAKLDQLSPAS